MDLSPRSTEASEATSPKAHRLASLSTDEFIAELHQQLAAAGSQIVMQLMTFDGDDAGLAVAEQLKAAARRGVRVRLLVDSFALRFVSDMPVSHPEVKTEYATTLRMYHDLAAAGVSLGFTNDNGRGHIFALARNHKKLYVIDDVAYLGGINISDHNFEWHDFMLRITDPVILAILLRDFDDTAVGRFSSVDETAGDVGVVTNRALEPAFNRLISGARRRVVVASPYALDRRLVRMLERSAAPSKTVVIAADNNFKFLQAITPYLVDRVAAAGVELFTYARFSHSKFLLADDQLLVGSSNFGQHSLTCNQEIGVIIRDRSFIDAFEAAYLEDLIPIKPDSSVFQRLVGRIGSGGMEGYLAAYARLVAPRVPLLAEPSGIQGFSNRSKPG